MNNVSLNLSNFWISKDLRRRAKGYMALTYKYFLIYSLGLRWFAFVVLRKFRTIDMCQDVVITLSTIPSRFDYTVLTLKTLLLQTTQPKRIKVFIEKERFEILSQKLSSLIEYGVNVIPVEKSLGPATKVIPEFMEENGPKWILWVDDDICYPRNLVKTMLKTLETVDAEDAVICNWAELCKFNDQGVPKPYKDWSDFRLPGKAPLNAIPLGVGGVLIARKAVPKEITNTQEYLIHSKTNDDFWFYIHFLKSRIPVYLNLFPQRIPIYWPGSQLEALWTQNLLQGRNDENFSNLLKLYPEVMNDLRKSK